MTLGFDADNNITSLEGMSISYSADGRHLASNSVSGGALRYFLYDEAGSGQPTCEFDTSGNLLAVNTFTPYGLVGRSITAAGSSNASVYGTQLYTFDRGGNVTDVVNASSAGIGIGAYYYTAYGYTNYPGTGAYVASGTTLADDTGPAHFGYGGQWGGQTESLSYRYTLFSHRWYDPAYGRWLTRDPIGYGGGMNLYAYADGDPVNNIDPSGFNPFTDYANQSLRFLGGEGMGLGNAAAGLAVSSDPLLMSLDDALGGGLSHPFNTNCMSEDVQNGASFGNGLGNVAAFFTPEGEAAEAAEGAGVARRILYRVVTEQEPTANFVSNAAKGLAPRGAEIGNALIHNGISTFDSMEGANRIVSVLQRAGKNVYGVAELSIPEGAEGISLDKTLGKGHYTITGDPVGIAQFWSNSILLQ